MIISKKNLLIAAAVVAGLIVLIYLKPWRLLPSSKSTIANTAITITDINEIYQLTTAEYYGEILASDLDVMEAKKILLNVKKDVVQKELKEKMETLYLSVKNALDEIYSAFPPPEKLESYKKRAIAFEERYADILQKTLYTDLMSAIKKMVDKIEIKYKKKIWLSKKVIDKSQKFKIENNDELALEYIRQADWDSFEPLYEKFLEEQDKEKNKIKKRKAQIVYIGRGWVKAGIRLSILEDEDFITLQRQTSDNIENLLIIDTTNWEKEKMQNLERLVDILDQDINPWFVPERGIKGFEVVKVSEGVKTDFKSITEVKSICKKKLVQQALERGILEKAKTFAEETLKHYLNLLLLEGKPEITKVEIRYPRYFLMEKAIAYDKMLNNNEVIRILQRAVKDADSKTCELCTEEDRKEFFAFIEKLNKNYGRTGRILLNDKDPQKTGDVVYYWPHIYSRIQSYKKGTESDRWMDLIDEIREFLDANEVKRGQIIAGSTVTFPVI